MTTISTSRINFSKVLDCRLVINSGIVELEVASTDATVKTKWFKSNDWNMLSSGSKAVTDYFTSLDEHTLNIFDDVQDPTIDELVAICRERFEQQNKMSQWRKDAVGNAWRKMASEDD